MNARPHNSVAKFVVQSTVPVAAVPQMPALAPPHGRSHGQTIGILTRATGNCGGFGAGPGADCGIASTSGATAGERSAASEDADVLDDGIYDCDAGKVSRLLCDNSPVIIESFQKSATVILCLCVLQNNCRSFSNISPKKDLAARPIFLCSN